MRYLTTAGLAILAAACSAADTAPDTAPALEQVGAVAFPDNPLERRLRNLRQLTHGGENAEAYFSADGRRLIFQATRPPDVPCDQLFVMDIDGAQVRRISTGTGRVTCGYFFPSGDSVVFSSTHHRDERCPPPPDYSRGYVWPLHPYDIFIAADDGSGLRQLTDEPGYDAEATISPDGRRIVFTSNRDGDLDIYVMDADGSNVTRLTHEEGYDGGAFFSPDGRRIIYRAYHPTDPRELEDYRSLLAQNKIRPGRLDIWVMDADGSNRRRVTDLPGANFAPFWHPSGDRVIFSSNLHDPDGRNFELYLINLDGTGLERITYNDDFDGFPMFSPDGARLVFASNRGGRVPGETNIFIADWVEDLPVTSER
jgi:TolB protein